MTNVDEIALARSKKQKSDALINPLIAEITEALLALGGSAHRDLVANSVSLRRCGHPASEGLRRQLFDAYDVHCTTAESEGRCPLLYYPFGPGSRRWALSRDALAVLQGRGAVKAIQRP